MMDDVSVILVFNQFVDRFVGGKPFCTSTEEIRHGMVGIIDELTEVCREQFSFIDNDPACHHGHIHVAALHSVDDVMVQVTSRP